MSLSKQTVRELASVVPPKGVALSDILSRSRQFERDIRKGRPTKDNWLEAMKKKNSETKLQALVEGTRPVVHEKVLVLAERFLEWKKVNGNEVEKKVYKDMSLLGLVDRLIKKVRAFQITFRLFQFCMSILLKTNCFVCPSFNTSDSMAIQHETVCNVLIRSEYPFLIQRPLCFYQACDDYTLRDGKYGANDYDLVGTDGQRDAVTMEDYMTYDEVKLAALVQASAPVIPINT